MDLRASGPIVLLSSIEAKMDYHEFFGELIGSPDQGCGYGMIFFELGSGSDFSDGFGSCVNLFYYF
jgi:hypothetical protein